MLQPVPSKRLGMGPGGGERQSLVRVLRSKVGILSLPTVRCKYTTW
jgi:hypothetical protein